MMKKETLIKTVILVSMIAGALFACTPKDKNDDQVAVLPFGACEGCSGYSSGLIFTAPAQGIPMFPAQMTIQAFGDAAMIQTLAVYTTSVAKLYSGPAYIQGTMNLPVASTIGYCVIPAGTYQFQTVQAGRMSGGILNVPQIEMIGPARITVSLQGNVVIDPDANGLIDRVGGKMFILQASGYMGSMIGCNDMAGIYLN